MINKIDAIPASTPGAYVLNVRQEEMYGGTGYGVPYGVN